MVAVVAVVVVVVVVTMNGRSDTKSGGDRWKKVSDDVGGYGWN